MALGLKKSIKHYLPIFCFAFVNCIANLEDSENELTVNHNK